MNMGIGTMLSIAVGGAVGSVTRWGVSNAVTHWVGHGFPWATMLINILGSFLIGVLVEGTARAWDLSPEVRDMIRVGFLGGFTTFSTFSIDAYTLLIEHKQIAAGLGYVGGSVILGLLALIGGMAVMRLVYP